MTYGLGSPNQNLPGFVVLPRNSYPQGGGTRAGATVGATDELGREAVECVHHIRDVHVTLLHLLGLDDNRLTYYHAGRFKQLSQFGGEVIEELLG